MSLLRVLRFLIFTIAVLTSTGCTQRSITVDESWARVGSAGGNTAIYFVINNSTQISDSLISANSDIAQEIQIHKSMMNSDGVMMMEQQEKVEIPSGGQVEFAPGGFHLMVLNLQSDLKEGDSFEVTLIFDHSAPIKLTVPVKSQ